MSHKSWEFQVGVEFEFDIGDGVQTVKGITDEGVFTKGVFANAYDFFPFDCLKEKATITNQPHKNLVEPVFEPCVQREVLNAYGERCILFGEILDEELGKKPLVMRDSSIEYAFNYSEIPETTKLSDSFPDQDVTPDQVERIKKILEEK